MLTYWFDLKISDILWRADSFLSHLLSILFVTGPDENLEYAKVSSLKFVLICRIIFLQSTIARNQYCKRYPFICFEGTKC